MLKLHLLSVEKSLKMVKNKRDLKSPRRNRSFGSSRPAIRRTEPQSNSSNGNIRVIIRVRPLNDREKGDNCRNVVKVVNEQVVIFDPKEDDEPFFYHGVQQRNRDLLKRAHKNLHFTFDHVFDTVATNDDVFSGSTKGLIECLMNGYNCSVFVYGATGAGKTHTMLGKGNDPGVTFRTMTELFDRRQQLNEERDFELGITYLEVYNENVQDLLNPGPVLHLREDGKFGVVVAGNKLHKIDEPTKLFELLEQGNRNRTQHPTDANAESSRSHAIFQVYLRMKIKATGEVRVAKLSMIDLAGSERGAATGYSGARFNEGANINKSLLALGNCINGLADGQKHVPYRDSKLTRLLKDSLGGNCQTIMVANVSPSSLSFEDTYNTLKYAMRATKIKSHITKNIVNCETNVHHYIQLVDKLTAENEQLKMQIAKYENSTPAPSEVPHILPAIIEIESTDPEPPGLQELKNLYAQKRHLEERLDNLSSTSRLMSVRKNIKEECDSRLSGICTNTPDKLSGHRRLGNAMSSLGRQVQNLNNEINGVIKNIEKTQNNIDECLEKAPSLKPFAKLQAAEISEIKANNEAQYYQKVADLQSRELKIRDNLIGKFCQVLQPCFLQLQGLGYATEELVMNYNGLVKHLQGIRSVTWEDESNVDSGVGSSSNSGEEEYKSPKQKLRSESDSMDRTFVVANNKTTPGEQLVTKDDSPISSPRTNENKLEIHANQLMYKAYTEDVPSFKVNNWMDGVGVKQLMTKLYDSPEDGISIEAAPPKSIEKISHVKNSAVVGSRHLMNKVKNPTPAKTNKLSSRSPRIPKENVPPFRARPVPLSNSIRPNSLIDKPKGILKVRPRCISTTRTATQIRK